MDIEFHYYITYLIALRAGFKPPEAYTVAYSAQHVDDNTERYPIDVGQKDPYINYISQTMDILKPKKELMRVYPIFHFMPGTKQEIEADSALRKDGKFHVLNTIPGNSNAELLLKAALDSKNLYRIGVASHMYADTFAHQNFVGYYESFNAVKGVLERVIPDVGHAEVKHNPDWPGCAWNDCRLIKDNENIDNKARFLEAAGNLYKHYKLYLDTSCDPATLEMNKKSLCTDIGLLIGNCDTDNGERDNRIARYKASIRDFIKNFTGATFTDYAEKGWLKEAASYKSFFWLYCWDYKAKPNFAGSDWFQFQQAVKDHQKLADSVLQPITAKLELERW